MSDGHHDPDEVRARIEAALQEWADSNIVGKEPVNEDTLASFVFFANRQITEMLPEGWEGFLTNPRIDGADIRTDGITVRPIGDANTPDGDLEGERRRG